MQEDNRGLDSDGFRQKYYYVLNEEDFCNTLHLPKMWMLIDNAESLTVSIATTFHHTTGRGKKFSHALMIFLKTETKYKNKSDTIVSK